MINAMQFVVLAVGIAFSVHTVFVPDTANRGRATDYQLLVLWLFLFLGWLK
jgi:hypothetical protein